MKLSIYEVAQLLDLPQNTVERWIRQGRIPIQKIGENCLFKEAVLKKWAEIHHLTFSLKTASLSDATEKGEDGSEDLLPVMQRGGVFYNIRGHDAESAIQDALDAMSFMTGDAKAVLYERLMERERLTSTGIGKGIAIPHPRNPQSDFQGIENQPGAVIATCFLEKPVQFKAVDEKPVFVMFILLSPSVKMHLHLLSRLSFCVRDNSFLSFLKTIPEPDMLFSRVAELESTLKE